MRWRNSEGQRIRLESGARMNDEECCCDDMTFETCGDFISWLTTHLAGSGSVLISYSLTGGTCDPGCTGDPECCCTTGSVVGYCDSMEGPVITDSYTGGGTVTALASLEGREFCDNESDAFCGAIAQFSCFGDNLTISVSSGFGNSGFGVSWGGGVVAPFTLSDIAGTALDYVGGSEILCAGAGTASVAILG